MQAVIAVGDDPTSDAWGNLPAGEGYISPISGDGRINADDYFRIDSGFLAQPATPTYAQGDFNYDGTVNLRDFNILAGRFGQSVAAAARRGDDVFPARTPDVYRRLAHRAGDARHDARSRPDAPGGAAGSRVRGGVAIAGRVPGKSQVGSGRYAPRIAARIRSP